MKAFIEMKDGGAASQFAWGMNLAAFDGVKRKAEAKAALRFAVPMEAGYRLSVDFEAAQAQTVMFRVNAVELGREVVEAGVVRHFERPLPANLLVPDTATLLEIDSEIGIGILRAGFIR